MHDASPSNRVIEDAMPLLSAELSKRYGLTGGCTLAQLTTAVRALNIRENCVPYLGAVFLSEPELASLRSKMTLVNWEEVDKRSDRISRSLIRSRWPSDDFHESNLA